MGRYTRHLPKGMLEFGGKPLLEWQMGALREAGLKEISIVTGYQKNAIQVKDVRYYDNARFDSTNMVESLMCAKEEFSEDVIVSYADIIYVASLVKSLAAGEGEITVAVDSAWREYWRMRYGTTEHDLETLSVEDGHITELGRKVDRSDGIDYRYIGLVKFSKGVWPQVLSLYEQKKSSSERWRPSGKPFLKGDMTDLINELIERGVKVGACVSAKQWLEFDTEKDYEVARECRTAGILAHVFGPADE